MKRKPTLPVRLHPQCVKLKPDERVVCLDERPIQLLKNIKPTSRLVRRGKPRKMDYEYERKGTAKAFCVVEPKARRHFVKVTKNRKADQFAEVMRAIGRAYPRAEKIHLVMDNLNTHCRKSLVQHIGPKRGANLWDRFDVRYIPKHGSWLNPVPKIYDRMSAAFRRSKAVGQKFFDNDR